MLLQDYIAAHAVRTPQRTALTFFRSRDVTSSVSYAALHDAALRVAAALRAAGLRKGDVALIAGEHNVRIAEIFLGAMYAGLAPAIAAYPDSFSRIELYHQRLRTLVQTSGAAAVLIAPSHASALDGLPTRLFPLDLDAEPDAGEPIALEPTDAAYVQFSSGTTGVPKAARVSHGALMRHLQNLAREEAIADSDVHVGWLPLYHDFGLIQCLLLSLYTGMRSVLIPPQTWVRRPRLLLEAIHTYRGTIVPTPNFGLVHTVQHVRESELAGIDLSSLRMVLVGSELVQEHSVRQFEEWLRVCALRSGVTCIMYGMAECVLATTLSTSDRPLRVDRIDMRTMSEHAVAQPSDAPDARVVMSCGVPIHGTALTVLDEAGRPLPERRVGEIVVSTDALFSEYIGQPARTARALQPDGLHTGDFGYLADGELFVLGRMDGVIIVAGRHVLPEGLEEIAQEVAGEAAGRAAAFGVFDERLGLTSPVLVCEIRGAIGKAEATQLAERIRAQVLVRTDVSLADVRIVRRGWLPVTTSGKVRRSGAAEKYAQEQKPARAVEPIALAEQLLQNFAAATGKPALGMNENLYEAGLHSLRLVQELVRVEKTYGHSLDLAQLAARPTVQEILDQIEGRIQPAASEDKTQHARWHPSRWVRIFTRLVASASRRFSRAFESSLPYGGVLAVQRAVLSISWVRNKFWRSRIETLRAWHSLLGDARSFDEVAATFLRVTTLRRVRRRILLTHPNLHSMVHLKGDVAVLDSSDPIVLIFHHTVAEMDLLREFLPQHKRGRLLIRKRNAMLPQIYRAQKVLLDGGTCLIAGDGDVGPVASIHTRFGHAFEFRSGAVELAHRGRARIVVVFGSIASDGSHTFDFEEFPLSTDVAEQVMVEDFLQRYSTRFLDRFAQNYEQWEPYMFRIFSKSRHSSG
jgi:acyl-CoA synthetase (AMP-forming)/AMP-acid ligase II/aryl carrier-like protein